MGGVFSLAKRLGRTLTKSVYPTGDNVHEMILRSSSTKKSKNWTNVTKKSRDPLWKGSEEQAYHIYHEVGF